MNYQAQKALILIVMFLPLFSIAQAYEPYLNRPVENEIVYFLLVDRFENGDSNNDLAGINGDRNQHGFDPTHRAFYHGGDLQGIINRLDYLEELGATALWLTPVFKNKAVQGSGEKISAAYHGYWITDFLSIDPHLGDKKLFKQLVDEAHQRNMKVIMDIVINHTADVIQYRECQQGANVSHCAYRSKNEYPYGYALGDRSTPINRGFISDNPPHQTPQNFIHLNKSNYAYTPFIPDEEKLLKNPRWLNTIQYYHNRGDSLWKGESTQYGDFVGLDDVFTEHPDVLNGFLEIYKYWISEFKIDGYRVDTAKHVNPEFWQTFVPEIRRHAQAEGINNFYIFAEVYSFKPEEIAKLLHIDSFPSALDFPLQETIRALVTGSAGPSAYSQRLVSDSLYKSEQGDARQMASFISTHDMGRMGHFITTDNAAIDAEEALKRSQLAHAILLTTRGVPVIYYGDEQGFSGGTNDQDARESMFPSQVKSYNKKTLLGTKASTADDNFDSSHVLYQSIKELIQVRKQQAALRFGSTKVIHAPDEPGALVFSRSTDDEEIIVFINTSNKRVQLTPSMLPKVQYQSLLNDCPRKNQDFTLPGLSYSVCRIN